MKDKIELIIASDSHGLSQRQLAEQFSVSKTQVQDILKRKVNFYKHTRVINNSISSTKRVCYRNCQTNIYDLMWRWFQLARSKNTPISGPMIQEQARMYAKDLQLTDFKASNGWLARFKFRHNIGAATLSGERASVDLLTVETRRERLPQITKYFALRDIYNMDETGLFYRALPDKSLVFKGSDCAGGKKSKKRITVAFCVNI